MVKPADTITFSHDFERALSQILKWEGARADIVGDRGGRTNMGITQATFSAWLRDTGQPDRDVFGLTRIEAEVIYWRNYWQPVAEGHAWPLNVVLFDVAVNNGRGRVAPTNGAKVRSWLYAARAGTTNSTPRLPTVLALRILALRERFYRLLALAPAQRQFLNGWLNRNNDLRAFIQDNPR